MELEDGWKNSLSNLPKAERRIVAALLMYTAWNVWKERNQRVFEGVSVSAPQVFAFIEDELGLRQAALRVPSVS
jgi:hypothetical protein